MHVEVLEQIPEQHSPRISELLAQCFGVAQWPVARRREHDDRFCSQGDRWRYVMAFNDDDSVVGFATVYRRGIERTGQSLLLGGIGDVCTDPDWRHQGIATAVAEAARAAMEQINCDVGYLCAAVDEPGIVRLYGQTGFVPLRRPHTYYGRSGRLYEDSDAMIAPICNPTAFEAVLNSQEPFHIGTGNW